MKSESLHQVTAQEARTQLSDLINRAVYARQNTLITRQGKPVAVLVSFEEWGQIKEQGASSQSEGTLSSHLSNASSRAEESGSDDLVD